MNVAAKPIRATHALHRPNALRRISALIWGEPGVGKTTLAATAPGRKLIYLFDPDGASSLVGIPEDVQYRKVYEEDDSVVLEFKTSNPLNIKDYLDSFDTFIFDSLTNVTAKTLDFGVSKVGVTKSHMPQQSAYGSRNVLALALVKAVLAITSKAEKHVIFTAHQNAESIEEGAGIVRHTNIALGGKLSSQIGPSFSEVWNLRMADSVKKGRLLMTRSRDRFSPIKTRMWQEKDADFRWDFDAEDWESVDNKAYRIDTWYALWNKFNYKLPHPGSKEFIALTQSDE